MKSKSRCFGSGPGYCYAGTLRFVHVVAESLELARLCCCPDLALVKTRTYAGNPRRAHFVFKRNNEQEIKIVLARVSSRSWTWTVEQAGQMLGGGYCRTKADAANDAGIFAANKTA